MLDKLIHKYFRVPYTLHLAVKSRARKPKATVVFIHGLGRNGDAWHDIIKSLPKNVKVLSIDLLGFGRSPKPTWAEYDAKTQARSVGLTLLKAAPRRPVIIVGHSLGALVAVEVAYRYSKLADYLVLCSPPFYREDASRSGSRTRDSTLKSLFRKLQNHPERLVETVKFITKYKLVQGPVSITEDNIDAYMATLGASIINQTSLEDAKQLKTPMRIIHGALDPWVIKKNLKHLVSNNSSADLRVITAGHEIKSRTYKNAVTEEIFKALDAVTKTKPDSKTEPSRR